MKKSNIKRKILLYFIVPSIIILITTTIYIAYNSVNNNYSSAKQLLKAQSDKYVSFTKQVITPYVSISNQLRLDLENYENIGLRNRRSYYANVLKNTILTTDKIKSIWVNFYPNTIDTLDNEYKNNIGSSVLGNFEVKFDRVDDGILQNRYVESNENEVFSDSVFQLLRHKKSLYISDPFEWNNDNGGANVLSIKIVQPVLNTRNNTLIGVVGIVIPLSELEDVYTNFNKSECEKAMLITASGQLVCYPEENLIGKYIHDLELEYNDTLTLSEKLELEKTFQVEAEYNNYKCTLIFQPVIINNTVMYYSALILKNESLYSAIYQVVKVSIAIVLFGIIILVVLVFYTSRIITDPIRRIKRIINRISQGNVVDDFDFEDIETTDILEIQGDLVKYKKGYEEKINFVEALTNGHLDAEITILSEDDKLSKSLIEIKKSLKKAFDENIKREKQDEIHLWTNQGVAKFANILQKNNESIKSLTFAFIKELVTYTNANQGGVFVKEDNNTNEVVFELTSAIAYNKERYLKKHIKLGEDLIGHCAHEKKTTYLKEIPDNYLEITSGMGTANPRYLLIVPAILNLEVYAIIELASFNEFEKHHIEFIERLGESLASNISSIKTAEKTQRLLEESQNQREELASQEEEMRQNLEELQTTQEEATRREFETKGLVNALGSSTYTVEYDLNGTILNTNDQFANLIGLTREQIIGLNHKDGIDFTKKSEGEYSKFWQDLKHGLQRFETSKIEYNERTIYLSETYTPILDMDDKPYKVLKIGFDITELVETQNELKQKSDELTKLENLTQEQELELANVKEELEKEKQRHKKALEQLNTIMATKNKIAQSKQKNSKPAEPTIILPPAGSNLTDYSQQMRSKNNELDQAREKIVALINQIYIGLRTEKSKKEIKEILNTLTDYAAWYFKQEEQYLERNSYPELGKHAELHTHFFESVQDFRKKYFAGKVKFYDDIMKYIKQWIEEHFTSDDEFIR